MRRTITSLVALALTGSLAACRQGGLDTPADPDGSTGDGDGDGDGDGSGDGDGGDDGGGAYPQPRDDLVPSVGTDGAVDIATWNIENFPGGPQTPSLVADLITSMKLDFIGVEEIADQAAFDELVERLPDHEAVLSTHTYSPDEYQKVGFIYRADLVQVDTPVLLFQQEGYDFPRPPMQVRVTVDSATGGPMEFVAIVLHLKAGTGNDDRERRRAAMIALEAHVATLVAAGQGPVVVLGDYNEILTSAEGRDVFAPFLSAPASYTVETEELASAGAFTFIPSGRILDHIISTADLVDEIGDSDAVIPRLDTQLNVYEAVVSDHLPVAIALPILD